MSLLSQIRYRFLLSALAFCFIIALIWQQRWFQDDVVTKETQWSDHQHMTDDPPPTSSIGIPASKSAALTQLLQIVATTSDYFADYPLASPEFGNLGKRLHVLRDWIDASESLANSITVEEGRSLSDLIDKTALSFFPFLRDPSQSSNVSFSYLRQRFEPGSRGIVIPTGQESFRYACHLISNLRDSLGSKIPIEVAYAGDSDLPSEYRTFIKQLSTDIEVVDITQVFDDTDLDLQHGGWAIKPFAALGSRFEEVMIMDADAVFVQAPEEILAHHSGYKTTGALLFHDRLLWQGAFKERHEWWEKQLEHHVPSPALSKSRVYNEGYAEECDSGLVVLDKSKLDVLLGILHVCWQNTKEVREKHTYIMGHGDKESWWFGMELSGAKYSFEDHYGAVLGARLDDDQSRVCGFTIAHVDEHDQLLWYNGSLLKNKQTNLTLFDVPTHWMLDGVWEKGATKADLSCMIEQRIIETTEEERKIIQNSVHRAQDIDARIKEFTSSK